MLAVLIRSEDGEEIRVEDKEKELKDGFQPQCYKIHLDISTVNVNNLIEERRYIVAGRLVQYKVTNKIVSVLGRNHRTFSRALSAYWR